MKTTLCLTVITLLLVVSSLSAATHYVSLASTNPTTPYATWDTAATNIQDAVNVAMTNDVVLVTNGVYSGGVNVTNPLTLLSVNGEQVTIISGGGPCVSLSDGASLTGFTLANGRGGVHCTSIQAFLTNCVLVGNSGDVGAFGGTLYNCSLENNNGGGAGLCTLYNCELTGNSATNGAGAAGCTLYNCELTGNSAVCGFNPPGGYYYGGYGGGAESCTLYNCVLAYNSARTGGGAFGCTLYNCTVIANSASAPPHDTSSGGVGGGVFMSSAYNSIVYSNTTLCAGFPCGGNANYDGWGLSTLNYCCTMPQPATGLGNITGNPLFVDVANTNFRLQPNSPCINAGNNAYVTTATDLDGNPRIVSGMVEIGAYEYQGTGSRISYAWLQQYGLPTDGSVDFIDSDGDGMNNWQEWVCGTCPTNTLSVLRMVSAVPSGTNVAVSWQSVAGISYFLQRTANLASPFTQAATNIVGQADTTSYTDTNAAGAGSFFYRVGVTGP